MRFAWVVATTGAIVSYPLSAQTPAPAVHTGFGVDTTIAEVRSIVQLLRAYLIQPDSTALRRGLWSASDKLWQQLGDIAAQAYQGFPATVVGVTPADPGDSVYVVKVLHALGEPHVMPLALQRLYAVREPGSPHRFRLSSALPRLTEAWTRRSTGPLTFWYAPGCSPNPQKIDQAARFVDSVARLFETRPPLSLDVYVTATMDEAQQAIGLDFFVDASGPGEGRGGRMIGGNIILVGDDQIGEAYLHELVHAVLHHAFPIRTALLSEGVATWLGGSRGRSLNDMYRLLRQVQISQPSLGLRDLVRHHSEVGGKQATEAVNASGALIAATVFRRHGLRGIRTLADLSPWEAVLDALPALLGLTPREEQALNRWWRTETQRVAEGSN